MRYTAHTDESLNKLNLLTPGIHDFEVVESEEKTSKSGNDMVVLKLHVFEEDGTPRIVFDYLGDFMPHKFKHAADACGLAAQYADGSINASLFTGKCGKVEIVTQPAKGDYLEKSAVKDYVKRTVESADAPPPPARKAAADLDDEIPF